MMNVLHGRKLIKYNVLLLLKAVILQSINWTTSMLIYKEFLKKDNFRWSVESETVA